MARRADHLAYRICGVGTCVDIDEVPCLAGQAANLVLWPNSVCPAIPDVSTNTFVGFGTDRENGTVSLRV